MTETTFNLKWIRDLMIELADSHPIFHNESYFQHELAGLLYRKGCCVKKEHPFKLDGTSKRVDVWLPREKLAIELKYWTKKLDQPYETENDFYQLRNQKAQNQKRYDFLRDVQKLERLRKPQPDVRGEPNIKRGYVVLLTNEPSYWKCPYACHENEHQTNQDRDFHLYKGRKIGNKKLQWRENSKGEKPKEGTTKGREDSICLSSPYPYVVKWKLYSDLKIKDQPSKFKYLAFRVPSLES